MAAAGPDSLRIVHCFRSPVGGIFRHVRDLVEAHSQAGHQLGILCDSSTGGAHEDALFAEIEPKLALGLIRVPMRRAIGPSDLVAIWRCLGELRQMQPDILHSHGAKGGAYARVIGTLMRRSGRKVARLYCPHGGSIHYDAGSLKGKLFFTLERTLERMTDRLIFVSEYEREGYRQKVGEPRCPTSLVYNGLGESEFEPVKPGDADFLYIGMMRDLKGPDLFLDALAMLRDQDGIEAKAHFVGDGPDKEEYIAQIGQLGLGAAVKVHDAMPAREAFAMAKTVVVPSRAESMPYIVLEAIAAHKPIIATRVGGIPEIFNDDAGSLVEPDNAQALYAAMKNALVDRGAAKTAQRRSAALKQRFSVEVMAETVETVYRASI